MLLVSTDPAHSLADSLRQPVGDHITNIAGVPHLFALELDASQRLDVFKAQYGSVLKIIADRGTFFDSEDINQFFDLSLPGIDELMAIIEVMNIVREGRFGLVILDTAPTGHTLRLLALPELMGRWLGLFDLMLQKYRYMVSVLGRYRQDDTDRFLARMSEDLERLRALLHSKTLCEFVPVTIPEPMSIEETARLVQSLVVLSMQVRTLVVNRVAPEIDGCRFCQARHDSQQRHLSAIAQRFPQQQLVFIPLMTEVRGLEALERYARILAGDAPVPTPRISPGLVDPMTGAGRTEMARSPRAARPWGDRELILVGGKGGVGKTTVATAIAVRLAHSHPDQPTLLFSCDPAHSLSDCLQQDIGDEIRAVHGIEGLYALEINPREALDEFLGTYKAEINEVFDAFLGTALDLAFDRRVMEELMALTPPGLDELMALAQVMDLVRERRFSRYVLDLAPTGHALRLLEMPVLVRRWFTVFFKLLLKYRGVVQLNRVADLLYTKSKELRQLHQLLADKNRSQFLAVTIPEDMAIAETRRLLQQLARLSMDCHHIVVNMLQPLNDCGFCGAIRQEQQKYLGQIEELGPELIQLPWCVDEPRGVDRLLGLGEMIYGETRR